MREVAVLGEFVDAVIHAAILGLIRELTIHQRADHLDHARDVFGGGRLGERLGGLDAQRGQILEERLLEGRGELRERDPGLAAAADRLVVHVGEVHHALDRIAARFEMTLEQVLENVRAEIADVRVAVDGRPAGVEFDRAGVLVERHELFELARISIKEARSHAWK